MNYMLVAEDNNYPESGGVAGLIGIYKTEDRARFIKSKVIQKYGENSIYKIEETPFPVTDLEI